VENIFYILIMNCIVFVVSLYYNIFENNKTVVLANKLQYL